MAPVTVRPIARPTLAPRTGTILDVASVADVDSLWVTNDSVAGEPAYETFACGGQVNFWAPLCQAGTRTKTFTNPGWATGRSFAVYRAVECKSVGFDWDEAEAKMRDAFAVTESAGIESALMSLWTKGSTDVTGGGGTALALPNAIGVLEQYASVNYGYRPTLMMSRLMGVLLKASNLLNPDGTSAFGTPVVAGGYSDTTGPGDAAPGTGAEWVYVLGAVTILRTPVQVFRTIDTANNIVRVLAERAYEVVVDCDFIAGAKAKQEACC